MLNFIKLISHFFPVRIWKRQTLFIKALTSVPVLVALLFSGTAVAQFNCPDARRCTSGDLEVVGAFLTGGSCSCSTTGTQTATLNMSINNKTGSTRTSFAFFGTLLRTGGTFTPATEYISRCGGSLPPNSITTIQVGTITYACNQTLSLTNVFLAWTDASGLTAPRCDEILADACKSIAPKCGTVPVIPITPLLSLSSGTSAACTGQSDGSITITPIGGTGPYSVTLGGVTRTNVTTSTTFTGLAANTYNVSVTDAASTPCTYSTTVTLGSRSCCTAPTIFAQPSPDTKCAGGTASFTSTSTGGSPSPTVQWQEKVGAGSFVSLSNGGIYSGVTTTTLTLTGVTTSMNGNQYRAVFTSGTCTPTNSNAAILTVNGIPGAPSVAYNAPVCDAATFSVTVGSTANPVNPVISGATYTIVDKNGNAISGVSPSSPYVAPNSSNFTFSNIPAGSGYKVTVTNNSCPSSVNSCGTATPTARIAAPENQVQSVETLKAQISSPTKVTAAPNPFSDRVRFSLVSDVSGQGSLELYNMVGQKVKTVFEGYVKKGQVQTIEYSVPRIQRNNMIYIFRVGDQKTSGKLIGLK